MPHLDRAPLVRGEPLVAGERQARLVHVGGSLPRRRAAQQLALATYKYQQPDKKTSLINAKNILNALAPQTSSDAETVGLWGAIHKRLWDEIANPEDLDEAVRAYARGYYIRTDYYNGINYAFVLDLRSSRSVGDEALVDRLLARRVSD